MSEVTQPVEFKFDGGVALSVDGFPQSLREQVANNVNFMHVRVKSKYFGEASSHGGATIACSKIVSPEDAFEPIYLMSLSVCSFKDNFDRKVGRELSVQRILEGKGFIVTVNDFHIARESFDTHYRDPESAVRAICLLQSLGHVFGDKEYSSEPIRYLARKMNIVFK